MLKPALKKIAETVLTNTPYFGRRFEQMLKAYRSSAYPPGHYHSTIPSLEEVKQNDKRIFENEKVTGINLHEAEQLQLLNKLKEYYSGLHYRFDETKTEEFHLRYQTKDAWYRYSDAIFLHCMMMHYRPKRVIEIGSGHSSAVMLDTNEFSLGNSIDFTFIEPFPENRLLKILRPIDHERTRILKSFTQDVDTSLFTSLGENDILFIDSTHVSKVGSDVNYIFFEILPVIKPGVIIHFHDIFYPFEMPRHWIYEKKWFWNETYMLRAFLMDNPYYEILLFNTMMQKKHRDWFEKEMSKCLVGEMEIGSIWLRKIK
jgi:hypothetical protein